ncbi:MAG: methionyl-tRNA formyltransferase [Gammaproteobacteria bacterium TMED78]|nr:MAG: methionyl-tRNA formyltransferase [Gammaproteobacteria bacterium TMED78]
MVNSNVSIAFAGTPDFSVPCLKALINSHYHIPIVFTQPDRPYGRGQEMKESEVSSFAKNSGLNLIKPRSLKDIEVSSLPEVDLFIVVAYGQIIPKKLLFWPRVDSINVHASLLPRWRGASPIQRSLIAGDTKTGVSIMRMESSLDTGPIFSSKSVVIRSGYDSERLHDILSGEGAKLLLKTLPKIINQDLNPVSQENSLATYAYKIKKSESIVDWNTSAISIENHIRAFRSWSSCSSKLSDGRVLKIIDAKAVIASSEISPGSIISVHKDYINVATGKGALKITVVQKPGGRKMSIKAYLNAHTLEGVSFVA